LDQKLKFAAHVTTMCRSCFFQLRQLRHIRRSLNWDAASTLIHSFVTNRLDYCNGLLANAPTYMINDVQRVLNAAARLLMNMNQSQPNLRLLVRDNLHWLRVPEGINYKLCITTY
jgi:hypothetical protein